MNQAFARLLAAGISLFAATVATRVVQAADGVPPFAQQTPPPVPDYAKAEAWAAGPGGLGAAAALPAGATPLAKDAVVDVFYVHPTTYRSKDRWNQDIADKAANDWTDASVIARQAGVFNGCCRIFAPRYRQGSTLSFTSMDGDGGKAFDLATGDVERAFDYYLTHYNNGRPFILASHSQGSFHLMRLLESRIDGTPLKGRMVAAYIIGVNLSVGDFPKTYKNLQICAKPAQTHCVVAWNALLPTANLDVILPMAERRYVQRHGDDAGKQLLCINPITFDADQPAATADRALGAVPGAPGEGGLQPLKAKSVAARCDRGELIVEPAAALGLQPLPGGSMHYHDYGLFYADIRANVKLRVDTFLKQK